MAATAQYDFIIIGSGFGGSVSALRLAGKGYRVLVIEKGKEWKPDQFPQTNWNLRKWLWLPGFRFFGIFKMTFLRHVGILSGVGVGGGSLVYANTLPRPKEPFFNSGNWKGITDWKRELEPHYATAEKMLGAVENPQLFDSDNSLQRVAAGMGIETAFEPTRVAVYFGEAEKEVSDPYFGGEGPRREGCRFCGACMTGCRYNAKNTLDKNYLYLARNKGVTVISESRVKIVKPIGRPDGSDGYEIIWKRSTGILCARRKKAISRGVVFSGGVLGTVRLMLDLKRRHLPGLSDRVGDHIRTNNESLVLVHSKEKDKDFSKGIAIGSIFPPDQNTHLEAVRYGSGSGFWKMMGVPLTQGSSMLVRMGKLFIQLITKPGGWLRILLSRNFSKESMILLFMQHLDSTVRFRRGWFNLRSGITTGAAPSAFMPLAKELADRTANEINGKSFVMVTEALTGTPTTAHILGGCVIGRNREEGVIDKNHRVFGYKNMYICDGSAISANPGVNPALTITAMTERAMEKIYLG
ncbi:MAG: GMC family oxidoreductase [Bacteroidales bacterium]